MAYILAAEERRRCTATRKNGQPCGGWAVWGDPWQRCAAHGGRRAPGSRKPVCRCVAYAWPHRPGGGLCRWPEEPFYRRLTPAGTHGEHRNLRRSNLGAFIRRLERRYGLK